MLLDGRPSRYWFVVATQPHREGFALDNLTRQNFVVYCPMVAKRIRHARRTIETKRALFSGYVFVAHEPERPWRPILGTYGVRALIRNGDEPSLLAAEFIAQLRAREVEGVIRKPVAKLQIGQQVAIESGPFEGLVGQILEMRSDERIVVLLNLLMQQTRVHIGSELLVPLPKPPEGDR